MTSATTLTCKLTCKCGASVFVSVRFDNEHRRTVEFFDMETGDLVERCPACDAKLMVQWMLRGCDVAVEPVQ